MVGETGNECEANFPSPKKRQKLNNSGDNFKKCLTKDQGCQTDLKLSRLSYNISVCEKCEDICKIEKMELSSQNGEELPVEENASCKSGCNSSHNDKVIENTLAHVPSERLPLQDDAQCISAINLCSNKLNTPSNLLSSQTPLEISSVLYKSAVGSKTKTIILSPVAQEGTPSHFLAKKQHVINPVTCLRILNVQPAKNFTTAGKNRNISGGDQMPFNKVSGGKMSDTKFPNWSPFVDKNLKGVAATASNLINKNDHPLSKETNFVDLQNEYIPPSNVTSAVLHKIERKLLTSQSPRSFLVYKEGYPADPVKLSRHSRMFLLQIMQIKESGDKTQIAQSLLRFYLSISRFAACNIETFLSLIASSLHCNLQNIWDMIEEQKQRPSNSSKNTKVASSKPVFKNNTEKPQSFANQPSSITFTGRTGHVPYSVQSDVKVSNSCTKKDKDGPMPKRVPKKSSDMHVNISVNQVPRPMTKKKSIPGTVTLSKDQGFLRVKRNALQPEKMSSDDKMVLSRLKTAIKQYRCSGSSQLNLTIDSLLLQFHNCISTHFPAHQVKTYHALIASSLLHCSMLELETRIKRFKENKSNRRTKSNSTPSQKQNKKRSSSEQRPYIAKLSKFMGTHAGAIPASSAKTNSSRWNNKKCDSRPETSLLRSQNSLFQTPNQIPRNNMISRSRSEGPTTRITTDDVAKNCKIVSKTSEQISTSSRTTPHVPKVLFTTGNDLEINTEKTKTKENVKEKAQQSINPSIALSPVVLATESKGQKMENHNTPTFENLLRPEVHIVEMPCNIESTQDTLVCEENISVLTPVTKIQSLKLKKLNFTPEIDPKRQLDEALSKLESQIKAIIPSSEKERMLHFKSFNPEFCPEDDIQIICEGPSKTFCWTQMTEAYLKDAMHAKLFCNKKIPFSEISNMIHKFLKEEVLKLWPQGWMTLAKLTEKCRTF